MSEQREFITTRMCGKCRRLYTPKPFTYCALRSLCDDCIAAAEALKQWLKDKEEKTDD